MSFSISPLQKLGIKAAGQVAGELAPAAKGLAGFAFGMGKMAGIGAGIGAIKGAFGDNYDSTSTFRNVLSGAIGGAAAATGARILMSGMGARGIYGLAKGSAKLAGKVAGPVSSKAIGAAGFLASHPGLALGGAAVVGGGMYMGGGMSHRDFSNADVQENNSVTSRSFQNSASGLVQGLNSRRHG